MTSCCYSVCISRPCIEQKKAFQKQASPIPRCPRGYPSAITEFITRETHIYSPQHSLTHQLRPRESSFRHFTPNVLTCTCNKNNYQLMFNERGIFINLWIDKIWSPSCFSSEGRSWFAERGATSRTYELPIDRGKCYKFFIIILFRKHNSILCLKKEQNYNLKESILKNVKIFSILSTVSTFWWRSS